MGAFLVWILTVALCLRIVLLLGGAGGDADNYRYFYSAVAQSIAALGALVLVASFTILPVVSAGARTSVVYETRFQAALGAVLACVVVSLVAILTLPSGDAPVSAVQAAAGCATVGLLLGALVAIVLYAMSIPDYLAEPSQRGALLSLAREAHEHQAPDADRLFAVALRGCSQDVLSALAPQMRTDLSDALGDLRRLSELELPRWRKRHEGTRGAGRVGEVIATWRHVAVGAIGAEGERGRGTRTPSDDIVGSLWDMAGGLTAAGRFGRAQWLLDVVVQSAHNRRQAGDEYWADRFWGTFRTWVGLYRTVSASHRERSSAPLEEGKWARHFLRRVLPGLVHPAFGLLLTEALRDEWDKATGRIGSIWGRNSGVERDFYVLTTRTWLQRGLDARRVEQDLAVAVFGEPLAAVLTLGGLALKQHPHSVRALAQTAMGFPEAVFLLEHATHADGLIHKYAMGALWEQLPRDFSEIGGTWTGTVPDDHRRFAILVRCAIEATPRGKVPFDELAWTTATGEWYGHLQTADLHDLAEQFAVTGVFDEDQTGSVHRCHRCTDVAVRGDRAARTRALGLLTELRVRLEELVRTEAVARPKRVIIPTSGHDGQI